MYYGHDHPTPNNPEKPVVVKLRKKPAPPPPEPVWDAQTAIEQLTIEVRQVSKNLLTLIQIMKEEK